MAVALKNRKATLLQHHGLIACEENLEKALWLAHEVEVLAQLYLSTLAITDPVPVLATRPLLSCWRNSKPTDCVSRSDAVSEGFCRLLPGDVLG